MSLTDFDWDVRSAIYATFARRGTAPPIGEIAARVGATEHRVRASLGRLHEAHEIAPLPDGTGVWMANPFSALPTDFLVETPEMTCYAACAWDAFGVPAILGSDATVRTHCSGSGEAIEFGVRDGRLVGDDGIVHLVTPLRDAWADIGFT